MSNTKTGETSVNNLSAFEQLELQKQQLAEAQAKVKEMQKALFEVKQSVAQPTIGKTGRVVIKVRGQRYPLSLHADQWSYIANNINLIMEFCDKNKDILRTTNEAYKQAGGKDDEAA